LTEQETVDSSTQQQDVVAMHVQVKGLPIEWRQPSPCGINVKHLVNQLKLSINLRQFID
jgi:hypothetical protein